MNKILSELKDYAAEFGVPIIMDESREIFEKIINENTFQNVLEIGTAIGYSGLLILKNSNCHLTTIEKDHVRFEMAKESFAKAGQTERVTQILGDASEFLCSTDQKFDFIFLDGPKGQYAKWLPYLVKMLNVNGIIFADNVLFKGMVKKEGVIKHKNRTIIVSLRSFLAWFEENEEFETILLEKGDGILIGRKV